MEGNIKLLNIVGCIVIPTKKIVQKGNETNY